MTTLAPKARECPGVPDVAALVGHCVLPLGLTVRSVVVLVPELGVPWKRSLLMACFSAGHPGVAPCSGRCAQARARIFQAAGPETACLLLGGDRYTLRYLYVRMPCTQHRCVFAPSSLTSDHSLIPELEALLYLGLVSAMLLCVFHLPFFPPGVRAVHCEVRILAAAWKAASSVFVLGEGGGCASVSQTHTPDPPHHLVSVSHP